MNGTLLQTRQPNTNSLSKEEHDEMIVYLKENGPTPLRIYLVHLLNEGKDEPFFKLLNTNSHLI